MDFCLRIELFIKCLLLRRTPLQSAEPEPCDLFAMLLIIRHSFRKDTRHELTALRIPGHDIPVPVKKRQAQRKHRYDRYRKQSIFRKCTAHFIL